jgi:hypothetical protein
MKILPVKVTLLCEERRTVVNAWRGLVVVICNYCEKVPKVPEVILEMGYQKFYSETKGYLKFHFQTKGSVTFTVRPRYA